jgi:pimeloyl-ACP methyl ester carboxylesterase
MFGHPLRSSSLAISVALGLSISVGTGACTSTPLPAPEGHPNEALVTAPSATTAPPPPPVVPGHDPSQNALDADVMEYRDLATHPGCTTDGLETRSTGCSASPTPGIGSYSGASIVNKVDKQLPGYKCAAKQYDESNEDRSKPILLLVHGNAGVAATWERFPVPDGQAQLVERAVAAGFRVYAVDLRFDKSDDPTGNLTPESVPSYLDHGWGVPIVQHFIDSVIAAFPDRPISIVGFSAGVTITRDALRRLHRENKKPFEHIKDLVFASGANHGIANGDVLCQNHSAMGCQLGDRAHYVQTAFEKPLNGPADGSGHFIFETPCLDGDVAFGQTGVCGGHAVRYTTVVMEDSIDPGTGILRDELVDEASAALDGASNLTVPPSNVDTSNYLCSGVLKNDFGSIRSDAGLQLIMGALTAP